VFKLTAVKALPGYRLWLHYADGAKGEVSLRIWLARACFRSGRPPAHLNRFASASMGSCSGMTPFCADALYLQLTNLSPEQAFSSLQYEPLHA